MPVTLPGPGDFAALPWHKRDKAIMAARALLRAYGGVVSEDMTSDGYRPSREVNRRADKAWGERVRAEARRLAGTYPHLWTSTDPAPMPSRTAASEHFAASTAGASSSPSTQEVAT